MGFNPWLKDPSMIPSRLRIFREFKVKYGRMEPGLPVVFCVAMNFNPWLEWWIMIPSRLRIFCEFQSQMREDGTRITHCRFRSHGFQPIIKRSKYHSLPPRNLFGIQSQMRENETKITRCRLRSHAFQPIIKRSKYDFLPPRIFFGIQSQMQEVKPWLPVVFCVAMGSNPWLKC